jgi:hypothetical protein
LRIGRLWKLGPGLELGYLMGLVEVWLLLFWINTKKGYWLDFFISLLVFMSFMDFCWFYEGLFIYVFNGFYIKIDFIRKRFLFKWRKNIEIYFHEKLLDIGCLKC